jgi:lysophospholipase L1-like esterase
MQRKTPYDAFYLCVLLIGGLLLFSFLPEFSIGKLFIRKVDPLADLKVFEKEVETKKAVALIRSEQDSVVKLVEEHCRPGITCIEDYSSDSTALKYFFAALSETRAKGKKTRIAFYGDSFIEGDVFCGSVRDTLQLLFGGRGVGYVPVTSAVSGFRNTIKHKFGNWLTSSVVKRQDSTLIPGPSGYCFVPLDNNWVEYQVSKQRFLRDFQIVKLYYTNYAESAMQYNIDDDTTLHLAALKRSSSLQEWVSIRNSFKKIRFEFYPHDSLQLYGASFEGRDGVYVDNFSMRGNTGLSLEVISDRLLKDFGKFRDYKLIILQFGLNSVIEDSLHYKGYTRRMTRVVNKLKKAYPRSSFLLLSVGDRTSTKDGRLQTMNAIPAMRNAQRQIAKKTGIAFWDMYEAMGGENSMIKFAQARPPLAAKDYTHLTFKGGRRLAGQLVNSILFEDIKYQRRKKGGKRK